MSIFTRKELGQHWLADKYSLQAIVEAAEVSPGDFVLEIGPGTGFLTDQILASGAKVFALEFDHPLYQKLVFKYADNNSVMLEVGDIRSFDLDKLPNDYKTVANIPYYLTANLFRKLIDADNKPTQASLLVQKEVAERASAFPGKLSFVAVALQMFYEVKVGEVVGAHLFEPPPKVDSQILSLSKRQELLLERSKIATFLQFVKTGFEHPRKKLISNLLTGAKGDKNKLAKVFSQLGIDKNIRAQELSLDDWKKLFIQLQSS